MLLHRRRLFRGHLGPEQRRLRRVVQIALVQGVRGSAPLGGGVHSRCAHLHAARSRKGKGWESARYYYCQSVPWRECRQKSITTNIIITRKYRPRKHTPIQASRSVCKSRPSGGPRCLPSYGRPGRAPHGCEIAQRSKQGGVKNKNIKKILPAAVTPDKASPPATPS